MHIFVPLNDAIHQWPSFPPVRYRGGQELAAWWKDYDEIILNTDDIGIARIYLFDVEGPNSDSHRDVGFFLLWSVAKFLHINSKYMLFTKRLQTKTDSFSLKNPIINCYTFHSRCQMPGFLPLSYAFLWDSAALNIIFCLFWTALRTSTNSFCPPSCRNSIPSPVSNDAKSYHYQALLHSCRLTAQLPSQVLRFMTKVWKLFRFQFQAISMWFFFPKITD